MRQHLITAFAALLAVVLLMACSGNRPLQYGEFLYQEAPRSFLPGNYVRITSEKSSIAHWEGFFYRQDRSPFHGEEIFAAGGARIDSAKLSFCMQKDDQIAVGHFIGKFPQKTVLVDGIVLRKGSLPTTSDTALLNRVVQITEGGGRFFGTATQQEMRTAGAQGGTIQSTKNIIDSIGVSLQIFPNGDLFLGRMTGDLGCPIPDYIEGFYITADHQIFHVPEEREHIDSLSQSAIESKLLPHNDWGYLLQTKEDLKNLYGNVRQDYDTPPMLGTRPAAVAPISFEPYETKGRATDSHVLTVRFLVGVDGHATAVQITDCSDKEAAEAAKACIRAQSYHPALKNGKPVKAWVQRKLTYLTARNGNADGPIREINGDIRNL